MANTITSLTLKVDGRDCSAEVENGAAAILIPASAYGKKPVIQAKVTDGTADVPNTASVDDSVRYSTSTLSVTVKDTEATPNTIGTVTVTVSYLPVFLQEKYYSKIFIGLTTPPTSGEPFYDPVAVDSDGQPLEVSPKLGWFYIDASTGDFYIYDGMGAWTDTGEKWVGGFL
jgi:hypothetical protein